MDDLLLSSLPKIHLKKTHVLSQVFNCTTNSYKLFWMMAILNHLSENSEPEILIEDLLVEMVSLAWHPVLLFHLSLGHQDMLQSAVLKVQQSSELQPNSTRTETKSLISGHLSVASQIISLGNYVPYRFLSPWFSKELLRIPDHKKNAIIEGLSLNSQKTNEPSPYFFPQSNIIQLNPSWASFFQENLGVISAFVKYHTVCYLQRGNPNTPNVVSKLEVPAKRDLSTVRRFWYSVKDEFISQGKGDWFRDIFSGMTLPAHYAIDHFCPWSFVVHDQIWNLVPIEQSVNSSKGDRLPDIKYYLPRMARLHIQSLKVIKRFPSLEEEFIECYRKSPSELAQSGEDTFCKRMWDVFFPLFTVAQNQGFQAGWRYETNRHA